MSTSCLRIAPDQIRARGENFPAGASFIEMYACAATSTSDCDRMQPAPALFRPPPPYKDDHDITYTHSLPSLTHCAPHTEPFDEKNVSYSALTDQHRQHMRRVHDLLHLSLLRQDHERAVRCFIILLRSQDWRPLELWKLGLRIACMDVHNDAAQKYLLRISRTRTALRPYSLPFLIREWIRNGNYQQAHEELSSIITSFPYRLHPLLHTYLGLLTLYIGHAEPHEYLHDIPHMSTSFFVPPGVRRTAKFHFENAVKVAPRYMAYQSALCKHRFTQHFHRLNRLRRRAQQHRVRLWRRLRQFGWVFCDDTAWASQTNQDQGEDSSDSMAELSDSAALPSSDYFGLALDFPLPSDESDAEPASAGETEVSEGPSLPESAMTSRNVTPEPMASSESEPDERAIDPDPTFLVTVPAVQCSVHMATTCLRWLDESTR